MPRTAFSIPSACTARSVEVDVHVVHGHVDRLKNSIAVVKGLQLEVDEIVFTGLASALALLSNEQKELGSLVIDMGGGTTEYVVYSEGIIKHTGVLAVGGDHVSNDLAYGLKVPLGRAEQLKIEHGSRACSMTRVKGQTISSPANWACRPKSSTSNICAASCRCAWRKLSSLIEAELSHLGFAGSAAGGRFYLRRRRAHSRHSGAGRRTIFQIARLPRARPTPSAASNPPWTSPNSPPPSAWSNSVPCSKSANPSPAWPAG